MPQTFRIPLVPGRPPALTFPGRCVSCGAPPEAASTLALSRLVARGRRQEEASVRLQVPHCGRCAHATKSVFLAGFIPFVLGFLLVGGVSFVAVAFGAAVRGLDEYGTQGQTPSLILGAGAGLFAGLAGAVSFEAAARLLLLPVYGRALWRAPMLGRQFMDESDYVTGLTGRLSRDATLLTLEFANAEVAAEFAPANAGLLSAGPRA